MSRARIFITEPVAPSAIERLQGVAEVEWNPDPVHIVTKDELLSALRGHDILFCLLHDKVDGEAIAATPGLRAIASMKITPSDVDVAEVTARRIPVTMIPPIVGEATADIHMGRLIAVARRIVEGHRLARAGIFPGSQSSHLEGAGVSGTVIGLVGGGGRIGREVARRAGHHRRISAGAGARRAAHRGREPGRIRGRAAGRAGIAGDEQRRPQPMDTKGNFAFEREIALCRSETVLDLRRKR